MHEELHHIIEACVLLKHALFNLLRFSPRYKGKASLPKYFNWVNILGGFCVLLLSYKASELLLLSLLLVLEGRKIKVRSTSLPVNCLFKRKLKIPRLFQVAASIRSFWQLLIFSCSSLSACNSEQPGCLVVCMVHILTVDIWIMSEDVNNRLNYLSSVNFCCSERIWSYDDYKTVKSWFLFLVYSDHHDKKWRITVV